jgi:peptide-methionine (R)-S-oxide reductase
MLKATKATRDNDMSDPIKKTEKTEDEWRAELSPDQFRVLRQKGTERAFTGAYWNSHDDAMYACAGCGAKVFASDTKYDSGSGWPSFTAPAADEAVTTETDTSHGMKRVEVMCARCGGHLGHVFDDGPGVGGKRFCINSASLRAEPKKK